MKKIKPAFQNFLRKINPVYHFQQLSRPFQGAVLLLFFVSLILFLFQNRVFSVNLSFLDYSIRALAFILFSYLLTGVIALLVHLLKKLPTFYLWVALASLLILLIVFASQTVVMVVLPLTLLLVLSILGGLFYPQIRPKEKLPRWKWGVGLLMSALLILVAVWMIQPGSQDLDMLSLYQEENRTPELPDPSQKGPYEAQFLTYGAEDTYREDFNQENSLVTEPVNGSLFIDNWTFLRSEAFGFTPKEMPLNAGVWHPDGEGPFPLVLMVHGNHTANDYSDRGYDYLGEILASRGYIFVSVDENFLNGSFLEDYFSTSPLQKDISARGWLLLEHLDQWQTWNDSAGSPFENRVDMDNIVLMGHSRGGEAVALAALYNQLGAAPEDANQTFDYDFSIKGLVSIAGTDAVGTSSENLPLERAIVLEDINYLSLQGSHDMDVSTYMNYDQYDRIQFSNNEEHFKSSLYIYGANHGQFNRVWGAEDIPGLANVAYNKALLEGAEQEKITLVSISAFLESTLKGQTDYQDYFEQFHDYQAWLPQTLYISDYWDSFQEKIMDFSEDIDPRTMTFTEGSISGDGLTTWQEEKVEGKWSSLGSSAVKIAWDHEKDSQARYTLHLNDAKDLWQNDSDLVFSLADSRTDYEEGDPLLDFTIQIKDQAGRVAQTKLSDQGRLLPMLAGDYVKQPFTRILSYQEPVFQRNSIPLENFKSSHEAVDREEIVEIQFLFDQVPQGEIYLRDIGVK